jgi:hypothetical protein
MLANQAKMDEKQAKADENQAKSDAARKADKEEMLAELKADRKAHREDLKEMRAIIKSWSGDLKAHRENGEVTMTCLEKTEARLEGKEEPASVEMKPEVAQQEVPREDAAVMPVRGLRKQRRGRRQAAGRREEPEKLNRGICGSREKLAAACRKVSRRATVAWRRRNVLTKS